MDGGRNGGLLEDQMNRQDENVGQNTEVTEPERESNSMELSDSDVGGNGYSVTSEPVLLLNSETDNKRTPVLLQYSFQLELSSGAQPRVEEENEEQEELLVLDPEHPLMKRFQSALKKHLSNQLERQTLELREKKVLEKAEVQRRQELAEEVYMVQELLAKLQASLEASHEANGQTAAQRRQAQDKLDTVKNQYHAAASHARKQRTQVSELQSKVDSMATMLLYMQKANTDLRLDIKAIINASNKAQRERTQAEEHKYQQDVYVERLTKHVEKLSGQIALFEVQITAQSEETKAAKETYSEAQLELDSLNVEHKQLFQQWNSSLVMMRRRDEAYNAMQEELRQINDQMLSLETKIDGYKKSITQEEEQNERLTLHLNQAQADCTTSHKLLTHSQNHQEVLQAQYSNYTQILQETEKTLSTLRVEREVYQSKLKAFRNHMEKESAVCLNLQDQIMNKLKEQFTHNNSAKYSCRLTDKTVSQRREKEAQLTKLENGVNAVKLESQMLVTHLNSLAPLHAELEKEMSQQHQLLSSREAEISGNVTDIERKQSMINIFNKKIKEIVSSTGHEDLSPLEICAATLSKELEDVGTEIKEQQQLWLWQQGELVRFTQEKQAHSCSVQTLRTQLTILQQSQINRKSEMEQDQREQADLENQIKDVMADMIKLNCLLSKNSDLNQTLQQNNSQMETEFRQRLKEVKSKSVETQLKLEMLNKEKERLVNSLVEAERLIMLWEKRTQLMRETWSAINSDIGQGDMRTMAREVHRMEVRYAQLMKQQERLLRDMESVVSRRQTIMILSEAQTRSDHMQATHTEYHTIQGLHRKILQTKKQSEECVGVIAQLEERQHYLSSSLREKQTDLSDLQNRRAVLAQDLTAFQKTKERNLSRLLTLQSQAKHLQDVMQGRYRPVAGEDTVLELEKLKQEKRLKMVSSILQYLTQECPQHHSTFHRLNLTLEEHLHTGLLDSQQA
ncbi:coiled-coil domain-containing protein 40 [Triplophysa rosa]|uniref:Coiled-coil domain-containing protein 40 n=1 Tax=Triplophysa rosa TaxID=992332 RepID=A0A9W8C594_TRIRA|nr:coiled-coil domain-containing protein 40 [Triplophysa rosa]KAI7808016.1 coiled-coil domain-containing protein 40 [Triplophysa rosa]